MNYTHSQKEALNKINVFLNDKKAQVFILKGYAGTGKTTIIKDIVLKGKTEVLAPTGRAAKILRQKIGMGSTIHSAIFSIGSIQNIENNDNETLEESFHYYFPLKAREESIQLIIVDESSMIANVSKNNEMLQFGTDALLDDLLAYVASAKSNCKIIFVGDPAQLPPVGWPSSIALQRETFIEKKMSVEEYTLTEVVRQTEGSGILNIATQLRGAIENPQDTLEIEGNNQNVKLISTRDIPSLFASEFSMPKIGNGVVVAFTNKQCQYYNEQIRSIYFQDKKLSMLHQNDLLVVANNNTSQSVKLFNGDIVQVVDIGEAETRSLKVWYKKKQHHVELKFRDVTILTENDEKLDFKIYENLLFNDEPRLSVIDSQALYIDFLMRWEQKHPDYRKESSVNKGSQLFSEAIQCDVYFNALQVKFGYAVTCHKAQGGEWETVFVDYSRRNGLNFDSLRWAYTATTRASRQLYMSNPPKVTRYNNIQLSEPVEVKTIKTSIYSDTIRVPETPFHSENAMLALKVHYNKIISILRNSGYTVEAVQSLAYVERYTFSQSNRMSVAIDFSYKKNGIFAPINIKGQSEWKELYELLNSNCMYTVDLCYKPSSPLFQELFDTINSLVDTEKVAITNIIEQVNNYYVQYILQSAKSYGSLQFYYNNKGEITKVNPQITNKEDIEITQLLNEFKLLCQHKK